MATTTALCTSWKKELMQALHNMGSGGHTLKLALIKTAPAGTYGVATTNYSNLTGNSDEVAGAGYTAGGAAMSNTGVNSAGTTGIADFGAVSWSAATFSTTAALMYNFTSGGRSIALWDFGGTQTVAAATFTINMPASGAGTSLIRIA